MRVMAARPRSPTMATISRTDPPRVPRPGVGSSKLRRTAADGDLGFELYRQHTLLVILGTCLRRSSEGTPDHRGPDLRLVERALEVHRDYVVRVHYPDVELVNGALEAKADPRVAAALVECKAEHARAQGFQRRTNELLRTAGTATDETDRALAKALRDEADRMEQHLTREEEMLNGRLNDALTPAQQTRLLNQIRRFDAPRIAAEIAVLVWASELGPSAD